MQSDLRLTQVDLHEEVELVRLELSDEAAAPLMERGVLPGCRLCPVRRTLFGHPVVRVDGTYLALRPDVAACLCVRRIASDE